MPNNNSGSTGGMRVHVSQEGQLIPGLQQHLTNASTISGIFQQPVVSSSAYHEHQQQQPQQAAHQTPGGYMYQPNAQNFFSPHQLGGGGNLGNIYPGYQGMALQNLIDNNSGDNSNSQLLSQTTRASPATVEWLLDNYEKAEGVSLPRSTIYYHYLKHCDEAQVERMNPASFGKLIRSVFYGLATRRLGTRGNSKYHYYGIKLKATSKLNDYPDVDSIQGRKTLAKYPQKLLPQELQQHVLSQGHNQHGGEHDMGEERETVLNSGQQMRQDEGMGRGHPTVTESQAQECGEEQPYLEHINTTVAMPKFPSILTAEDEACSREADSSDMSMFGHLYQDHCQHIMQLVAQLELAQLEPVFHLFWRSSLYEGRLYDANVGKETWLEQNLPKDRLLKVITKTTVLAWCKRVDYAFYQSLVEMLVPSILNPVPGPLTQKIRSFAKNLEQWIRLAVSDLPKDFSQMKTNGAVAFALTLRRYTSLNHLAQAARTVLHNEDQINQMFNDLNRVDFTNLQEQAGWVCGQDCDPVLFGRIEKSFKTTLAQQSDLEKWAEWLEGIVADVMQYYKQKSSSGDAGKRSDELFSEKDDYEKNCMDIEASREAIANSARKLLLNWSFYSSLVIRDLTLRSAASFGSFHLLRLLYDEYLSYVLERHVAEAYNEVPLAIVDQSRQLGVYGRHNTAAGRVWKSTDSYELLHGNPASSNVGPAVTTSYAGRTNVISAPGTGGASTPRANSSQGNTQSSVITLIPTEQSTAPTHSHGHQQPVYGNPARIVLVGGRNSAIGDKRGPITTTTTDADIKAMKMNRN